jgi:exodeoxyribonuclease V gamma subunit
MPIASARFHLISGNRLDRLAAHLGARLASPADPESLAPEVVLIPQPAMRQWLQQTLAERDGIAANLDLLTPSEFVWRLLRDARPDLPESSPWDRERLRWRLYASLADRAPTLPSAVQRHLQRAVAGLAASPGSADFAEHALARYGLADALAAAYDKYQAYRPEWLQAWERNDPVSRDDWQAQLWRGLRQRLRETPHRAALIGDWLARHDREADAFAGVAPPGLPSRVAAFGTIHVSPDVLHLLAVVGQWIELDFYLPTPSAEYWGDVESLRERVRRDGVASLSAAFADLERDNPLLAAWGAGGREIVAQLFSYDIVLPHSETELFASPGRDTLLHRLQQDVLDRAAPTRDEYDHNDVSLQLHACHSKLREIEVLHDQLRALLDDPRFDPPLQPREIAVLAPDIADYLPLARAVFGGLAPDDPRYIPYSLADRPQTQSHPLVGVLLDLLALADTPLTASGFRDLLSTPAIAHALQLDAAQRAKIDAWFDAAGIRWGEDEAARERAGAGRWREYSFDFGIDRLLSGYAAGADAGEIVADEQRIAPYPELEGADADILDRALEVYRRLREWIAWMHEPHTAADWRARLAELLQSLLAPIAQDQNEAQARQRLLDALDDFADEAADAGALPARLVQRALREALTRPSPHRPWLSGGVTFAGMVPLRTVPFRVICLLGLDADAYPRREPSDDINRIVDAIQGRAPRSPGDRSVRDDDRFLFLQLLCAAGDVFYLSYGGCDARDASVREPSPVIAELLHAVERMHGESVREALCLQHPLQPFSPRAFGAGDDGGIEPRRFSYRGEWRMPVAAAAQALEPPFVSAPSIADAVDAALSELEWPDRDALQSFFANPAKAWLRDRLGLRLATREDALDDREPQGRDPLRRYGAIAALTADESRSFDDSPDADDAVARRLRARAALPPGRDGDALIEETRPLALALRAQARAVLAATSASIEVVEATAPVAFRFDDVHRDADGRPLRLILETGKLHGKRRLRAGLDHLLLASVHGAAAYTMLLGEGDAKQGKKKTGAAADDAPPVAIEMLTGIDRETAQARLRALLEFWRRGQSEPLPFAPKAGWTYVHALQKAGDPAGAWRKAWEQAHKEFDPRRFQSNAPVPGEAADPWLDLAFRPRGLFDTIDSAHARDFREIARAIFAAFEVST